MRAGVPVPTESVAFTATCRNFVPNVDLVVVTNNRLLGMVAGSGEVNYETELSSIDRVFISRDKGHLSIYVAGSPAVTFKGIPAADLPRLTDAIEGATLTTVSPGQTESDLVPSPSDSGNVEGAGKAGTPYYGRRTLSSSFGGKSIEVYESGYIRMAALWMRDSTPFERLQAIEAQADVTKKSGLGRSVGAVMTMGVNLASANRRGDVYLTITTENDVYVLTSNPTDAALRESRRLEAVGNAAIHAAQARSAAEVERPQSESRAVSVVERLGQLAKLLDAEVISQEEFHEHRERILRDV